jgi:dihydroorotase
MLRFDTNLKMNPPLRSRADMLALRDALADGTLDCIASDHAPHTAESKALDFVEAPFGVVGLETTLAVVVTELVETGTLDWPALVAAMTVNPAGVLRLAAGTLAEGADADVIVIDPGAAWTVDAEAFASKSRNTPFGGRAVKSRTVCVITRGEVRLNLLS